MPADRRAPTIRVGTSGWVYPPWRGTFYPTGLPQRRELEHLSTTLNSVEINGTFYALQKPDSFRRWSHQTPDDFVFSVKAPRFLTHMIRLRDPHDALANFFASGVLALGHKLGPILWQLPATFAFDADVFAEFFSLLPRSSGAAAELATAHDDWLDGRSWTTTDADRPLRHAVEPRHTSFRAPEAVSAFRDAGVAVVLADSAGTFPVVDEDTADFRYVRLHGDDELYVSGYTDDALDRWAARLRDESGDVYAYFDNDAKVRAPVDAQGLLSRLA